MNLQKVKALERNCGLQTHIPPAGKDAIKVEKDALQLNSAVGEQAHKCTDCELYFPTRFEMLKHRSSHYLPPWASCLETDKSVVRQPEILSCEICGKIYKSKQNLNAHRSSVHSDGTAQIRCNACGKMCKHKLALYNHKRKVHTGKPDKYFVCDICGRQVKSMHSHMKHVHNQQQTTCDICNKTFSNALGMLRHRSQSHTERNLTCHLCGASFKTKRTLKKHFVIHSEERNHQCATCGKTFKFKMVLKTHQRVHTGLEPYTCDNCGETFKWKQTYNNHISKCVANDTEPTTADVE